MKFTVISIHRNKCANKQMHEIVTHFINIVVLQLHLHSLHKCVVHSEKYAF